ncbi:hypothetical protein DFH06DRAFT_1161016 [Mycena polygramma]|nr:hypothetical protein DFH06DRAFT_1161016 [Mycena polygramma]
MPSKRPIRRRGRAPHASDSDEEDIERAAQTDSDESNDSLDESDSDSDSEPVSRHLTPNTSHSPDADEKPAPFFAATPAAWADMVDDAAGLPVITFGELDAHAVRKVRMAIPDTQPESDNDDEPEQPVASSSRHSPAPPSSFVRSPRSQSARQAYQHRLESDPSFVPVVGEFWGHDDRLLDKDLRSLSGWWRGRWQGQSRGRARGGAFPPRGRGRGGFSNPMAPHSVAAPDAEPAAPVDRTWTHDGFEEMRRREDTRTRPPMPRGGPPMRGSPSFRARGIPLGRAPGRIWFTMKPEHMWTKQHDAFLYFDPALKPRPGQPPGVRVHLPGGPTAVVRALPRAYRQTRPVQKRSAPDTDYVVRIPRRVLGKAKEVPSQVEDIDAAFTVKLPPQPAPVTAPAPPPPHPLQPDADGWVRPTPAAVALAAAASPPTAPPSALPAQAQITHAQPPQFYPFAPPPGFAFPPGPTFGPPPPGFTQPPPAFPQQPPQPGFSHTPPPGFTTHTPPPGFGTPPGFSAPLPPGVALDARGMPFELASGRPVVLQAPVPVMFPGYHSPAHHAHSLSMHGHGHAHSMSMGHGHSPSMSVAGPGPDPTLFAFARPGRVEIRAPGSGSGSGAGTPPMSMNGKVTPQQAASPGPRSPLSPSPLSPRKTAKTLRTGAAAFVPSHGGSASMSVPPGGANGTSYFGPGAGYEGVNGYENAGGAEGGGANGAGVGVVNGGGANGVNGVNGQGQGYEAGGGGGGPGGYDPYGAYAPPGATYYYPYYGAPAGPVDGTVYYQ